MKLAMSLIAIGTVLCIEAAWFPLGWSPRLSKDAQVIVGAGFLLSGVLLVELKGMMREKS